MQSWINSNATRQPESLSWREGIFNGVAPLWGQVTRVSLVKKLCPVSPVHSMYSMLPALPTCAHAHALRHKRQHRGSLRTGCHGRQAWRQPAGAVFLFLHVGFKLSPKSTCLIDISSWHLAWKSLSLIFISLSSPSSRHFFFQFDLCGWLVGCE